MEGVSNAMTVRSFKGVAIVMSSETAEEDVNNKKPVASIIIIDEVHRVSCIT